jgi:hypothetical protein
MSFALNPGSPTLSEQPSVGVLEIDGARRSAQIIRIEPAANTRNLAGAKPSMLDRIERTAGAW